MSTALAASPPIGHDVRRIPRLTARIHRLLGEVRPDVVMASGAPWEPVVATALAARARRVPFVADLRDPWSFGPVAARRPAPLRALETSIEGLVLGSAAAVIVTSEATRAGYEALGVARRVERVRTGFDPTVDFVPRRAAPVTFVHFGNCYGQRDTRPYLRALAALAKKRALGAGEVRLLNLGRVAAPDLSLARALGVEALFEHRTVLPYSEGLGLLAGSDLALLPGFGEEPWFVPGKLYDHLLVRVPTLAAGASLEVARLLEETGLGWAHARDDVAGLTRRMEDALDARRRGDWASAPSEARIQALSARSTSAELARLLTSLVRT